MTKVAISQVLLERLIETNGMAVRKTSQNAVYWYTSDKPGPYYFNTENIAGEQPAESALEAINKILKDKLPHEEQAIAISETINKIVQSDEAYEHAVDSLLQYYAANCSYPPTIISGGERRDWFFSIPIARKLGLPHLFIYKSGEHYLADHDGHYVELDLNGQKVLHVADIINMASSYLDRWIPILKATGAEFTETLVVAVRNQAGVESLNQNQISVLAPLSVDLSLFTEAHNLGLINTFALNEITLFSRSPVDWVRAYLTSLNDEANQEIILDPKDKERERIFKSTDPYQLKSEFPLYFQ